MVYGTIHSQEKGKQIQKCKINHNCIKVTVVYTIYYYNHFVTTSCCFCSELNIVSNHLKHRAMLIIST